MTSRLPTLPLFLLLGLTLSCDSDPSAPCADAPACDVEGVDLAIVAVDIDWAADQPVEPALGAHLVAPGDTVELVVALVNRGDERSAPAAVVIHEEGRHAGFDVPALDPGEWYEQTARVYAPTWADSTATFRLSARLVEQDVPQPVALDDANDGNNVRMVDPIEVALPTFYLFANPLVDTIRVGEPFTVNLTINNSSPVTDAGPVDVAFCLIEPFILPGFGPCMVGATAFSAGSAFESLVAGDWEGVSVEVAIPPEATWLAQTELELIPCLIPDGAGAETLHDPDRRACGTGLGSIVILPAIEAACQPPAWVAPDTLSDATPTQCSDRWGEYVVRAIDANEGDTFDMVVLYYDSTVPPGFEIRDADGAAQHLTGPWPGIHFTAPADGTYYLLVRVPPDDVQVPWALALE